MSAERTAIGIRRLEENPDLELNHEDAVLYQILDEKAATLAGHEIYGRKSDPKLLVKDGFLRGLNLERLRRGYLYEEEAGKDGEEVVFKDSQKVFDIELFSYNDLIRTSYRAVAERHNSDYAGDDDETKIPRINPVDAHIFLREEVMSGKVKLAKDSEGNKRRLKDVDSQDLENEKMFYFPRPEYHKDREDVKKEREVTKGASLRLLMKNRNERVEITGDEEVGWITADDLVDVFVGLADNSKYRSEPDMYLSRSAAENYIREEMRYYDWEERTVAVTMETEGNELAVINEVTQYRAIPQE